MKVYIITDSPDATNRICDVLADLENVELFMSGSALDGAAESLVHHRPDLVIIGLEAIQGLAVASACHTVGIIGLDDAVRIHCGESMHESDRARKLAAAWLNLANLRGQAVDLSLQRLGMSEFAKGNQSKRSRIRVVRPFDQSSIDRVC